MLSAAKREYLSKNHKVISKMWLNASRLLVVATFFLFLSCSASAYVDNGEEDAELVHESSRLSGVSSPKEDIVPLFTKDVAVRQSRSSVSSSYGLLYKGNFWRFVYDLWRRRLQPSMLHVVGRWPHRLLCSRTEVECDAHPDPRRRAQ